MIGPPLNSPLETGIRVVFVLAEAFPSSFDIQSLVRLDHMLLHTGQNSGPPSIHPEIPGSIGELAMKHDWIKAGVDAMMRAGLVSARVTEDGFRFSASENAGAFVAALGSPYATMLHERASWLVRQQREREPIASPGVRALVGQWIAGTGDPADEIGSS
jgi:hypothetical protein